MVSGNRAGLTNATHQTSSPARRLPSKATDSSAVRQFSAPASAMATVVDPLSLDVARNAGPATGARTTPTTGIVLRALRLSCGR
ncbi:hypothetical protein [Actinosynnema pretiosum]|uniref:hypothetical protein n=1 Tax=Actinosynnema pretiosum TaxID=42197 RepID=UPI0012FDC91B|nr:hypothetical protein [Actinosynnema pretiosum]